MSETTKRPPAERDLLTLCGDPYPEILEAFEAAYELTPEEREKADHPSVPPRMIQIGDILVSKTVRLIRAGTLQELGQAAEAMSDSICQVDKRDPEHQLGYPYNEAARHHDAAAVMLAGAVAPSSAEGGYAVLRSYNGLAAKLLCAVAEAPDDLSARLTLQNLEERTSISPEDARWPLANLECASLVEGIWDGAKKYLLLGPCARDYGNPEIMVLARYYAGQYDAKQGSSD